VARGTCSNSVCLNGIYSKFLSACEHEFAGYNRQKCIKLAEQIRDFPTILKK